MIDHRPLKIAVASGKGGTGKTMVSTNLAALRSQSGATLLVDLDVEEPNDFLFIPGELVHVSDQFKMIPDWDQNRCTLCGICSKVCKYHAVIQLGTYIAVFKELCHGCYACSELCPVEALPMRPYKMGTISKKKFQNLTFLESRLEIGEEQAVPLIHQTHDLVDKNYADFKVQIFDCPPGTSCPVVAAVKDTDFVLLVTEPTPFGLNDLKLAVETMRKLGKPVGVVINRHGIGNDDVEVYCRQQQIPVLAKIPFSRQIAELYSKGSLAYQEVRSLESSLQQIFLHIQNTVKP